MGIDSKHPAFLSIADDYRVMRDSFAGERTIKQGTFAYLPATAGQNLDGARTNVSSSGAVAYNSYLVRAQYPEFVSEAVNLLVSVMHQEPAVIELPPQLEAMRESATQDGVNLQGLLRKINEQQLLFGRYGLLADFPQDPFFAAQSEVPHLVEYGAECIINWDDERLTEFSKSSLAFLVTNETLQVRGKQGADFFDWVEERRFRVFQLGPEDPEFGAGASNPLVYTTFTEADDITSEVVAPAFKGRTLDFIPFVLIGSNDMSMDIDEIPLLGLANLSLAIYRQEADYKQALHVLGQDTLVLVGTEIAKDGQAKSEDQDTRIGVGAVIRMDEGSSAEFIGINAEGVPEMRSSLGHDKSRAQSMGPRLLESRIGQAESGEALRARVASQTATLQTLALTAAAGLEKSLRQCAVWVGADPEKVLVRPNLEFTQETVPTTELTAMAAATGMKIPLSIESIHKWLQKKNFTRETFEDELREIAKQTVSPSPDDPRDGLMENETNGSESSST